METSKVSQKRMILGALESGITLTPLAAIERFGCFRLAARIKDLREEGHLIVGFRAKPNDRHFSYSMAVTYVTPEGQVMI